MNNSKSTRTFYDSHYRKDRVYNPAFEIYDTLRIKAIKDLKDSNTGKILIVGCGSQRDFLIPDDELLVAFDLSFEAIKLVKTTAPLFFVGDALQIPLSSQTFDVIICSEVLEHIANIRQAVSELKRLLKPGGTLIVSSPNWFSWFGAVRWLGEKITGKSITSDDQPYDDWKTIWKYRSELSPEFQIMAYRGIWYLPPMHFRGRGLSREFVHRIFRVFAPLESFFSQRLPFMGHLMVIQCKEPGE